MTTSCMIQVGCPVVHAHGGKCPYLKRFSGARRDPADPAPALPGSRPPLIRVAVVHADTPQREALALMLAAAPDMECVATVAGVRELLAGIGERQLDLALVADGPDAGAGLKDAIRLKTALPGLRVVLMAAQCANAELRAALACVIDGLLLQPFSRIDLLGVCRAVIAGGFGVPRGTIARLLAGAAAPDSEPTAVRAAHTSMKPAEEQILELLARGLRYKEIADRLDLSKAKMKRLTARAYAKLGATSRIEAINHWRDSAGMSQGDIP